MAIRYHDAQLYERDLALFPRNQWLNDAAMHFYLTMIHHEMCGSADDVLLMDPAVASCMLLQCDDQEDLADLANGLDLHAKALLLLPVNDRSSFASQGSHWALLVYRRATNAFEFYDSSSNHNLNSAHELARVLLLALGRDPATANIQAMACAQQTNGFDCGLYACLTAEWISRRFVSHGSTPAESLIAYVTPARVRSVRESMPSRVAALPLDE
ncbi:hypothetical protein SPRG_04155 [Saprolegnia parasitica CBS 223.65]|uniref:Ubiquitin-like protease family profile domain-containing protein n=1 Tax=Saprolegnia parasitica (strain CBS 223.65) TaxID=695850 RepID=A0A067CVY6_SAPPC|nr:hypothetical protein SPRG_04155 [Saprolegnia parasitica CBS 223.65]KDO30967.1 hypothetical protein SPRG_04155 [Saprolegnia parasitica CBS 223.65]|eukprot:XP_012198151.1 hypothetical protein SPRG_04155 [Saprolegnia parasitica CBS 223.65]